ncbi:MAG: late competence development ComFB family protein [Cyanobacteria bacterium P01_A01_bin.105]
MGVIKQIPARAYTNVMEVMVAEEVERQIAHLPPRVMQYIKSVEVETYALNRLPSLYASSEKGWQCQYDRAGRSMRKQVSEAVRQAIAAVQIDPIRASQPLQARQGADAAEMLGKFRKALRKPNLTWEALLKYLSSARSNRQGTPTESTDPRTPSIGTAGSTAAAHRPGTYGGDSWRPKRAVNHPPVGQSRHADFDWGDSRYR